MTKLARLLAVILAVVVSLPALAQKEKGKKQAAGPIAAMEKQTLALDLTDEQKKKVTGIFEEYKKKAADAQVPAAKLTKEQQRAKKEATQQAKADGKKRKELQAAVAEAVKLTDEQKKAQEDQSAKMKELQGELKKKLSEVLTAEQLEKVGGQGKKNKKNA